MSALTDLRTLVGDTLTAVDPDWPVLYEPVDAVAPPCFMLVWGPDPVRVVATNCYDTAALEVIVIPGRLTVEGAVPLWEAMNDAATAALCAARLRPAQTLGPGPLEVGQVTYLAGRIQLRQPVTVT